MKWPNPRTILAFAVFLGILGFTIGGIIAALNGRHDAEAVAPFATLLGTIVGGVTGYEIGKGRE